MKGKREFFGQADRETVSTIHGPKTWPRDGFPISFSSGRFSPDLPALPGKICSTVHPLTGATGAPPPKPGIKHLSSTGLPAPISRNLPNGGRRGNCRKYG